jgi:glycosyltransferase involved in cell wall biosynthesis
VTEVVFAVPGDLDTPTGGYAYARRVLALLPAQGVRVRHLALPRTYPAPSECDLMQTAELVMSTPDDALLVVDGLAYGAMPASLVRDFGRPVVALVHHPLCLENGLSNERAAELRALETDALGLAAHVVATSAATRRLLCADFRVPEERITVAEPGTDPAPRARGTGTPVHILAVGAISPRKGYDIVVAALAAVAGLDWRATIAGAVDRAPETAAALRRSIAAEGLSDRVTLAGAVDDATLAELYRGADVFVSASHFEGYGMGLAEALARGLPLATSTGGAAAETVPDGAALKVAPGDVRALAGALGRLITDPDLRRRLSEASWTAGQALPRWPDTARRIAAVLKAVGA